MSTAPRARWFSQRDCSNSASCPFRPLNRAILSLCFAASCAKKPSTLLNSWFMPATVTTSMTWQERPRSASRQWQRHQGREGNHNNPLSRTLLWVATAPTGRCTRHLGARALSLRTLKMSLFPLKTTPISHRLSITQVPTTVFICLSVCL